ncbi:MAG: hypothetical protein HOC74_35175 [Gemmatimonadetes bacterium]|nr:hypothetical protein [Gemmatimonadota bacterium]MBT7914663.1 hypothetical protein [Candidatus Bathyarchaeota archaeon]
MKRLTRQHLCSLQPSPDRKGLLHAPDPQLHVVQGESFCVETYDAGHRLILSKEDLTQPEGPMAGNPTTGPVYVENVHAGDVIAITIELLDVVGHTELETGVHSLLPEDVQTERFDFIEIQDGVANFPGGLRALMRPMFGTFGVIPMKLRPDPFTHGGNMDIPYVCQGSTIHLRCERDGGYFACGDGHALQGDGEINAGSLEVSLDGILRIEKSPYQELKAILIETDEQIITVGIQRDVRSSITEAVHAMSDLFARKQGVNLHEAYQFVSHVGDIRVGAIWPLWDSEDSVPIPFCLHLTRQDFDQSVG